jgi:hypothetical protein
MIVGYSGMLHMLNTRDFCGFFLITIPRDSDPTPEGTFLATEHLIPPGVFCAIESCVGSRENVIWSFTCTNLGDAG